MGFSASETKRWLAQFGYIDISSKPIAAVEANEISEAIKKAQIMYGLKPTGEADAKFEKAMNLPRCGNPDIHPLTEFAEQLYKWNNPSNIPYWLNYDRMVPGLDLPKDEIRAIIRESFNAWSAVGKITFIEVDLQNQAKITISSGKGSSVQFDGPGNTLAWAELPVNGGGPLRNMIDEAEIWQGRTPRARGIKLLNTETHEIGHLIGLTHSRLNTALMAPTYTDHIATPQEKDDIPRTQHRYPGTGTPAPVPPPGPGPGPGPGPTPTPHPTPPTPPTPMPRIAEIKIRYVDSDAWNSYFVH